MALSSTTFRTVKYFGLAGIDDTTKTDGAYSIIMAIPGGFDQIQVTFRNFNGFLPAYECLIAPTDENAFADTTKRAMPIVAGVVNNQIDSGPSGWKTVTFDGGTLTKKSMQVGGSSKDEALLTADFIDCVSIPSIDDDKIHYLLLRIVPDAFSETEGFTIGNGMAEDNARVPDQFNLGHVQTSFFRLGETITPGTGAGETLVANNDVVPISIVYRSSVTGLTCAYTGDSRSDNAGRTTDKINDWATQAISIISTPGFPLSSMALGMSGGETQEYFDVSNKFNDVRASNIEFYSAFGPNATTPASTPAEIQDYVDASFILLDDKIASKSASGGALIVNTWTPQIDDYNTVEKDDIRKTANTALIANADAKGYTINDLDALVTDGASPAGWIPALTNDDTHPNEFCINEVWAPHAAGILGGVVGERFKTMSYEANATRFGTNNYLSLVNGNSLADGKQGIVAGWINIDAIGSVSQIFDNSGSRVEVFVSGGGSVVIRAKDLGNTKRLDATLSGLVAGTWTHVIFSWDLLAGTVLGRINGVSNLVVGTNENFDLDYSRTDYTIGNESGGGSPFIGCIADWGFGTEFKDIDTPSELAKFYDVANDVAVDPTLSGVSWRTLNVDPAATVEVNSGSLGVFTRNGSLVDCATSPPFIPDPVEGAPTLTTPYQVIVLDRGTSGSINLATNWTGASTFLLQELPPWMTQVGDTGVLSYTNVQWGGQNSDNTIGSGVWSIQVKAIDSTGLLETNTSIWLYVQR